MLGTIKTLSLLQYKANWQSERAQQLSKNIANADTPNYKRQDIQDFVSVLKAHSPQIRQINTAGTPPLTFTKGDYANPGGAVLREKEVMELTENATENQATIQLMKKCLTMLRAVAGK